MDSGTSYVYGQPAQIEAIYKAIPGAKNATAIAGPGLYTVPCDNIPTFNLTIGGRGFPIDPKILNQGRINGTNDCVSGLAATTNASAYKRLVSDVLPLTLRVQTSGSSEAFSSKMFIPPSIPPRRP